MTQEATVPKRGRPKEIALGVILLSLIALLLYYTLAPYPEPEPAEPGKPTKTWNTVNRMDAFSEADKTITVVLKPSEYIDIYPPKYLVPKHNETELAHWINWSYGSGRNYFIESSSRHMSVETESNSSEPFTILNREGEGKTFRVRTYFNRENLNLFTIINDGERPMKLKIHVEAYRSERYVFKELITTK